MAQYIIPAARNTETGQVLQSQDLSGVRFQPHQRKECQLLAERLAQQLTQRSGVTWRAFCQSYPR